MSVTVENNAAVTSASGRLPHPAGLCRGLARDAAGPAALSQRDRQVQHPPRLDVRQLRPLRRVVSRGRAPPAGRLPAGHPPAGLSLHRAGLREDRPLLHRRLPAAGAFALARIPSFATLGDCRWTPDLIVSTWQMAETGRPPEPALGERNRRLGRRFRSPSVSRAAPRRRPACGARTSPRNWC